MKRNVAVNTWCSEPIASISNHFRNLGVLDQCYSNNNFVTTAVLGVRNYVLLETRLREFNGIAVDVGGVGDLDFECVTKMDDISILLIRSENQW